MTAYENVIAIGVQPGERVHTPDLLGTEDYDYGVIERLRDDQAYVAWDGSQVKTWAPLALLARS